MLIIAPLLLFLILRFLVFIPILPFKFRKIADDQSGETIVLRSLYSIFYLFQPLADAFHGFHTVIRDCRKRSVGCILHRWGRNLHPVFPLHWLRTASVRRIARSPMPFGVFSQMYGAFTPPYTFSPAASSPSFMVGRCSYSSQSFPLSAACLPECRWLRLPVG